MNVFIVFLAVILVLFLFIKTSHIFVKSRIEQFNDASSKRFVSSKRKSKPIRTCDSYFVSIPQDLPDTMWKGNGINCKSKKSKPLTNKEICQSLLKSGWNPKWKKSEVKSQKKNKKIIRVRDSIRKNIGFVSERQLIKCFPDYNN